MLRISAAAVAALFALLTSSPAAGQPVVADPSQPPAATLDPSLLPPAPPTLGELEPVAPAGHGLAFEADQEAALATLATAWQAEDDVFLSRLEATPYTAEQLEAAALCLAEGGDCDTPVAQLLDAELTRFDEGGCGTADAVFVLGLASRIGTLEELGTSFGQLPAPAPPLQQTVPLPANCGPKAFRSPAGRFDLFYDDCDPRILGTVDSAATLTDLTGTTVTLRAGGGTFNLANAPDSVERTAVLLDSAFAMMAPDFTLRTGGRRYTVHLADVPLSGLTGAVGYVSPVTGEATISPSRLPPASVPDLRDLPSSVAVHEFIHQVQFDYGWNLAAFLFDDNANFHNFSPTGRQLLEGTAEAVTNHVHSTLPVYFPFRRDTNYYDFWGGNRLTGGRDPLGYGWTMQALSTDPTGTPCTGCEIGHQLFTFFGTNVWSRDAFFRFVAGRNPRLTPLEIPRQYFLHTIYDRFANLPPELVRPTQRLARALNQNINPVSYAPGENNCQQPAGTSYAIQSQEGSTVRCRFRPFPVSENGIPHMVYLPVDDLPEQLLVRLDISYRDARTGQVVTKIGGRTLENSVTVIEASGGRTHFDHRLFNGNKLLRRHDRRWGSGGHLLVLDTYGIDRASGRPDYRSRMGALAFIVEWYPTPPTANLRPTWDITVTSRRLDADLDGVPDRDDLCPLDPDPANANGDGDHLGDACDDDRDNDRIPNATDLCPDTVGGCSADRDGDNLPNAGDNCPDTANWDQADGDGDGVGDACDGDAKPDLVVTFGGIPPAGAGFVVKNVGTATARGPVRYHVSGYATAGGYRSFFQRTLDFPLPAGGLAPGGRASTEIPEHVIDPAQRSSYQNVRVTIDSQDDVDELDETNNSLEIR